MTDAQIWQLVGAAVIGALASIGVAWINKKKSPIDIEQAKATIQKTLAEVVRVKAETETLVADSLEKVVVQMRLERAHDMQRIEANQQQIHELEKKNHELETANDECEFEHSITRLQLEKVLNRLQMLNWKKASVFVLDDDAQTVMVFRKRFERVPVVDFKDFTVPKVFLEAVQEEKPEIVLMDMVLPEGLTADQLIEGFGYVPAIFIMSATKDYEVRFRGSDVIFFYKDRHFVRNITKAILEHLKSINRDTHITRPTENY